jgi:hypothetical protein
MSTGWRLNEFCKNACMLILTVSGNKCQLFVPEAICLGVKLSVEGTSVKPNKIDAISKTLVPRSLTKLRSFLGTAGLFKKWIKMFAVVAKPLYELYKKGVVFGMKDLKRLKAFKELKLCLQSAPIL